MDNNQSTQTIDGNAPTPTVFDADGKGKQTQFNADQFEPITQSNTGDEPAEQPADEPDQPAETPEETPAETPSPEETGDEAKEEARQKEIEKELREVRDGDARDKVRNDVERSVLQMSPDEIARKEDISIEEASQHYAKSVQERNALVDRLVKTETQYQTEMIEVRRDYPQLDPRSNSYDASLARTYDNLYRQYNGVVLDRESGKVSSYNSPVLLAKALTEVRNQAHSEGLKEGRKLVNQSSQRADKLSSQRVVQQPQKQARQGKSGPATPES